LKDFWLWKFSSSQNLEHCSLCPFQGKKNALASHQGNGRPPKRSRNTRYDEYNVVDNKQKKLYLISSLSTASPPDTLGNGLIDSSASRHFTGYKEALPNLIERVQIYKLSLETMPPIP